MKWFDEWMDASAEKTTRGIAQHTSRRGFLGKLAGVLAGGAVTVPLLPVARAQENPAPQESGDPADCAYWRYCAIDGFLCGCCGGSMNTCPPGTEMSPITWIGTCRNPVDNRDYIISYNDCCGKASCGNCLCQRNEGDRPVYNRAFRTTSTGAWARPTILITVRRRSLSVQLWTNEVPGRSGRTRCSTGYCCGVRCAVIRQLRCLPFAGRRWRARRIPPSAKPSSWNSGTRWRQGIPHHGRDVRAHGNDPG